MKSYKFWLLISVNITILGCQKQEKINNTNVVLKISYEDEIKKAKSSVKASGDEISYSELVLHYLKHRSIKEEILPYTILMVEKHKKLKYASKVFENFLDLYTGEELKYDGTRKSLILYLNNIEKVNVYQKNNLLHYLNIGAKNKSMAGVRYLEILNREGIGIPKNIKVADSLKEELIELEYKYHIKKRK